MKKIFYTVALFLAASAAQAQAPIKQSKEQIADVTLLSGDLLIYTKKEDQGQYVYREVRGSGKAEKDLLLSSGTVNAVIGTNAAGKELYVYQQSGRRDRRISVYKYEGGNFSKIEERLVPRFANHSQNLGMHLTADKNQLFISGELARTKGYDDLYLSVWENGKWSKPKNMAGAVNKRQAEFAPFVSGDSLYFSRKQGEAAYVYAVPLKNGEAVGEPVRLDSSVNRESAFNAYYKKAGERELWVTVSNSGYAAYINVPPVEQPPVVEPAPEAVAEVPAAPATQQLYFGFNEVYMNSGAEQQLREFLEAQQPSATILVSGYSDGAGSLAGREKVSSQRAAFVKWYISNKFQSKNFTVDTSSRVLEERGEVARRVELQVR